MLFPAAAWEKMKGDRVEAAKEIEVSFIGR